METQSFRPKLVENTLLLLAGLLVHAPLHYQLPRWAMGLDPTFVHPKWLAHSSFPFILQMAGVHPIVWIVLIIIIFARVCRNYGWKLVRGLG